MNVLDSKSLIATRCLVLEGDVGGFQPNATVYKTSKFSKHIKEPNC